MFHIDEVICNGCGKCVEMCPQQAITIDRNKAVMDGQNFALIVVCVRQCAPLALFVS